MHMRSDNINPARVVIAPPSFDIDSDRETYVTQRDENQRTAEHLEMNERRLGLAQDRVVLSSSRELISGQSLQVSSISDPARSTQATIGGAIQINNRVYLMTAAHPFRDDESATVTSEVVENELRYSDSEDDESDQPRLAMSRPTEDRTDATSNRLVRSVENNQSPRVYHVTAGTFVIGTLWFICDMMSSPELDYALIEMAEGINYQGPIVDINDNSHSMFTIQSEFKDINEAVETRAASTPGIVLLGHIARAPAIIRLPYFKAYQEVYEVKFVRPLGLGDCGSWVQGPASKKVHGHIIAGSPKDGIAYIVPLYQVIDDLRSALAWSRYHSNTAITDQRGYSHNDNDQSRHTHQDSIVTSQPRILRNPVNDQVPDLLGMSWDQRRQSSFRSNEIRNDQVPYSPNMPWDQYLQPSFESNETRNELFSENFQPQPSPPIGNFNRNRSLIPDVEHPVIRTHSFSPYDTVSVASTRSEYSRRPQRATDTHVHIYEDEDDDMYDDRYHNSYYH